MWKRQSAPDPAIATSANRSRLPDLGSQLEDLITYVMRCEKWARFDDRLDLAVAVEQARPRRRRAGR